MCLQTTFKIPALLLPRTSFEFLPVLSNPVFANYDQGFLQFARPFLVPTPLLLPLASISDCLHCHLIILCCHWPKSHLLPLASMSDLNCHWKELLLRNPTTTSGGSFMPRCSFATIALPPAVCFSFVATDQDQCPATIAT